MSQIVYVTYLEHSAFAVYTEKTALIFDYARGAPKDISAEIDGGRFPGGYVTYDTLKSFERVYVFVSHSHGDHYDHIIYKWMGHPAINYIFGNDVEDAPTGFKLSPGESRLFPDLTVTARSSTDIGVSFMIDWHERGITLFHAGDLNLWHWRDESTLREIELAEQAFYLAMEPIYGAAIDIAFFPVDPRQGAMYDAGAVHFIARVCPKLFFPMHFQGRDDVALDFARRNTERHTQVIPLIKSGETIEAIKEDSGMLKVSQL